MKKLTLLILSFYCLFLNAQLKVNSNGEVGISTDPVTGKKLTVSTSYYLKAGSPGYGLTMDGSGYYSSCPGCVSFPRLYVGDNAGSIGSSSYYFHEAYINDIWSNSVKVHSDIRLKENVANINGSSLSLLMKLQPIKFDYKKDFFQPNLDSV